MPNAPAAAIFLVSIFAAGSGYAQVGAVSGPSSDGTESTLAAVNDYSVSLVPVGTGFTPSSGRRLPAGENELDEDSAIHGIAAGRFFAMLHAYLAPGVTLTARKLEQLAKETERIERRLSGVSKVKLRVSW